ncbi:MAG: VRR-NUC domain-containing protein, partial [Sinobacteraceae bacterium]|nr:VRR-NUC domain-containing protein [Nevskiaceae bacterium]
EWAEQCVVVDAFAVRHPEWADVLIHIPNGGSRRNAFEGWRLKRQGTKPGVSDLLLPVPRGRFHGLWVEFKATPPYAARVTADQRRWLQRMLALGYQAQVCRGPDAALAALDAYLVLSDPPREAAPVSCRIQGGQP